MTELRVTRSWVRESTDERGAIPEHWIYRCVGDYEAGRAYVVHVDVTPEMAEYCPVDALEEVIRQQWRICLAETLGTTRQPPPERRG